MSGGLGCEEGHPLCKVGSRVWGPHGEVPWARLPAWLSPASVASAASLDFMEEPHLVHPFTPPWNQHLLSRLLGEIMELQLAP